MKFLLSLSIIFVTLEPIAFADVGGSARIYGGYPIKITDAPWMAQIRYRTVEDGQKFSYNCAYDSNEPRVDLKNASQYEIRIGSADSKKGGTVYSVSEIHPHPQYDNKEYFHDMAILKLTTEIKFIKNTVQKVRLDGTKGNYKAGTSVMSMGWGENPESPKSNNLYRVNLSYENCTREWGGSVEDYEKHFVCAYGPKKGDVCEGDSGNPLILYGKDNIQIGTVSFGSTCPQKGSQPGLYSKIADNLAWINSVISGGNKDDDSSCES